MKNTFGDSVSVTLFGESHGEAIGAVLDGMAPGIVVDEEFIRHQMELRKSVGSISTKRKEADEVKILSGVFNGRTTGTPICFLIENNSQLSADYAKTRMTARPGHADYTAMCKYHGYEDYRGGGHFSGRLTAGITASGALAIKALEGKGIRIGTHIAECASVKDIGFTDYNKDIDFLSDSLFPVLSDESAEKMKAEIEIAKKDGDSVGGILESVVVGMPSGVGEPFFDSLESILAHALFSIPAVKGVEFGKGFSLAGMKGSEANDAFRCCDEKITTTSNNNGGINGGISNGMPIIIRSVVKPTPSIYKEQESVNMETKENVSLVIKGRHDPAIVHRARVVQDSMIALTLCDMLAKRYGTDFLGE